jgi:hypothetical protein
MNVPFIVLLLVCCTYSLIAGGTPERVSAVIYSGACFATHEILHAHGAYRWLKVEQGVLAIDLALFAAFCLVALYASRLWPIWASALLGLGVLGHIARMYVPDLSSWAYAVVLTIWSYPILLLMTLGTWRHQKDRTRHQDPLSGASS